MIETPDMTYDSSCLLENALTHIGYTVDRMLLAEKRFTRFTAPSGKSWITGEPRISYPFTSAATIKICAEKHLAYEFVARLGITIPNTAVIVGELTDTDIDTLLIQTPLVVKPSDSAHSNGLTLAIQTRSELQAAINLAHVFSEKALVQQQIEGNEIRFPVLKGKVKAAIMRQPARLIGDGTHTLEELLHSENEDRRSLEMPYVTYPEIDASMMDVRSFEKDKVLDIDEMYELNRSTIIKTGSSAYNVHETVHSSYVAIAEKLANELGADFIVVDMIIRDHTVPASPVNYSFLEFNTGPLLRLFYSCRDGKQYDVLSDLVPLVNASLQ